MVKSSRLLTAAFTVHSSFSDLISKYDGFILDQYGVLHNGRQPLPGAVDCVKKLVEQNKKLVILSNTSSVSSSALNKIRKIGFDPEWFNAGAVTSGEEASRYIQKRFGSGPSESPKKAIWLTYSKGPLTPPPEEFLGRCGNIELAESVDEADFIIGHGAEIWLQPNDEEVSIGSFMQDGSFNVLGPLLAECRERAIPFVCANPDFIVKVPSGTAYMPGEWNQ